MYSVRFEYNSTLSVQYNMSEHCNKQTMNKSSYKHKDMQTHTKQKSNICVQNPPTMYQQLYFNSQ